MAPFTSPRDETPPAKERPMSAEIYRRIVVIVVATLVISGLATHASAEGRCKNKKLVGSYAFQIDGTNLFTPFAAVGRNTYESDGDLRGVIVFSLSGASTQSNYTGTYTLNDDCTGIKTAILDAGLTVHFFFVVDNDLREIRMIVTDPGFTVSGTARKLFTRSDSRRKDD
jgi:hypothetical protein